MTANRLSGFVVLLAGIALYLVIIPMHTEQVGSGWIRPDTLPNVCAVLLALLGAWHAFRPTGTVELRGTEALRAMAFALIAAAGIWMLARLGFLIAAPITAAAIMLAVGERRPLWLLPGIFALPAIIWFAVVVLLDRVLP